MKDKHQERKKDSEKERKKQTNKESPGSEKENTKKRFA